ncbi:MAG: hypothetical protein PHR31_01545 [Candidatus Pacebacteria bacterium]|nr:hypothetical protein [Candidatus Paceibacterota bacterium]MDD4830803.1 hypothetical protein [Candidatus Paceibacterota bacterium]
MKNIIKAGASILFGLALYFSFCCPAAAAELYFEPQNRTIQQCENFTVEVWLDTQGENINAVEASLLFSQGKIELADISQGGSLLDLWLVEPSFSNQTGEINFSGGIPNGFQGKGKILSLAFSPVPAEADIITAQIIFQNGSKVLLNDGYGTEASLTFKTADFVITAAAKDLPVIISQTHPNQSFWYADKKPLFSWEAAQGADYSYQLIGSDKKIVASGEKIKTKEENIALDFDLSGESDGVFYFSLRQKLPGQEWSQEAAHFRIMADTVPPEDFFPQIGKDEFISEGKYFVSFAAKDKTSGVDYYEASEIDDWGIFDFININKKNLVWRKASSPYLLADQSLKSKILIKAVDKAGNERIAKVVPPNKTVYWQAGVLLLILVILVGAIVVFKKKKIKVKK